VWYLVNDGRRDAIYRGSKIFKSFLDEAFGFIGYAGLNPAYKIKVKTLKGGAIWESF
jgi:hypothetical protein